MQKNEHTPSCFYLTWIFWVWLAFLTLTLDFETSGKGTDTGYHGSLSCPQNNEITIWLVIGGYL